MLLLADPEWAQKSDRWIGEACAVGHQLVAACRSQLDESSSSTGAGSQLDEPSSSPAVRLGRDGKARALPSRQNEPARVAAPAALAVAFAPTDEASAVAALEGELTRHLGAWPCEPEDFAATLEQYARTVRDRFVAKAVANA